jgi:hypothetical protein
MPRRRLYTDLGSSELVEHLFDAAFGTDAQRFEDLIYEIQGGEDGYQGRGNLTLIRAPLVKAAQRVFELDK